MADSYGFIAIEDEQNVRTIYKTAIISALILFSCTILFSNYANEKILANQAQTHEILLKMETSEATMFTMCRYGYSPLSYFSLNSSEVNLKYSFLDSYNAIIEPYADMDLVVQQGYSGAYYYMYTVCESSDDSICDHGFLHNSDVSRTTPVNIECDPDDATDFEVSVTAYSENDEILGKTSFLALCQYVRREIRALSSDDLASTLDAMYAMWVYDDDDGQEKYGINYHSNSYMVDLHFFNAAWQDAVS